MELFKQLQDNSLQMVEGIITTQHAQLIANADEVKNGIRVAFGSYIEWLRNREAFLLKSVDRAMEAHLARSQTSLADALSSLRVLQDSVGLLDCDGTGRDIKDQIEKLVRDMTLAMENDMKVTPVVRFEEKGQSALRSVIESCGEVFTETKNVFNPAGKALMSSKWSSWLQSPVNMEHMEEPELPYDFDDMGAMMSFAKMAKSPSTQTLVATEETFSGFAGDFTGKATGQQLPFGTQFAKLMSAPLEQWLAPSSLPVVKKRHSVGESHLKKICPGEIGHCAHVTGELEIENLHQLKCPSPVAKDLQNWLMQPDVVPLPPVADICRAGQPCASLAQCTSPADHCIGYFFTLSKRTEDWLTPSPLHPADSFPLKSVNPLSLDPSTHHPASGPGSSCGDEFEVISWSCASQGTGPLGPAPQETVREELRMWLKATSPPLSDCEWLTDCCMEAGCRGYFPANNDRGIQEWLMKTA